MLSWITGRGAEEPPDMDATYIEPPETPAPVFAVRAFKHAIFGTPAPAEATQVRAETPAEKLGFKAVQKKSSTEAFTPRPGGILSTPGTARGRKTVTFGAQVVDNEGKKQKKSGLPTNIPGKFPSPWTPKVEDMASTPEVSSAAKARSKLLAASHEAKESSVKTASAEVQVEATKSVTTTKPRPKAKDDGDITIDMMEPRSESGRYWKEQYMSYSEKSEKEVKKLVTKQQLAKNYAKQKDSEAMELAAKLETERKRHKQRERELESKNKDLQERLRQALAENSKTSLEIATLRQRVEGADAGSSKDDTAAQPASTPQEENTFDQLTLDPQQASHVALEASPAAGRRRTQRTAPGRPSAPTPRRSLEQTSTRANNPVPDTTGNTFLTANDSEFPESRATSARKPRRPTAATRSARQSKTDSAVEDLWMGNGPSAAEDKGADDTSFLPQPTPDRKPVAPPAADTSRVENVRPKADRSLQPLSNLGIVSTARQADEGAARVASGGEKSQKELAKERVAARLAAKRSKENARPDVVSMR